MLLRSLCNLVSYTEFVYWPMKLRRLRFAVLAYAVHALITGKALSLCDYTPNTFYVVNTTATSTLFPHGFVACVNVTENDAGLCDTCLCREKKVASVEGVPITGIVCVRSEASTPSTCAGRDQVCCGCNDSDRGTADTTNLLDGSALNDPISDAVSNVDRSAGSTSSPWSTGDITPAPATNDPSAADSSASNNVSQVTSENFGTDKNVQMSIPTSSSESTDPRADRQGGSHFIDKSNPVSVPESTGSHIDLSTSITSIPGIAADSGLESTNVGGDSNKNRINSSFEPAITSNDLESKITGSAGDHSNTLDGTVETNAVSIIDHDLTHLQDDGSTFSTNNGSSSPSAWSGKRLTTGVSAICIAGLVVAIAIFVVMRRDQLKKKNEPRTPMDDYNHDGSSTETPTIYGKRASKYYGGTKRRASSFENESLASIVILGPGDDFFTTSIRASEHQYRRYSGEKGKVNSAGSYSRPSFSKMATQEQFYVSHGPSIKALPSPSLNPIFDTSNTHESFSSNMSSQFNTLPGNEIPDLEEYVNSDQMLSEMSRGSGSSASAWTNSCERYVSSEPESEEEAAVSILPSVECDDEHPHEPEMNTNSSRIAISFDI
ncbi:hypothetical protein PsorP6_012149 [Peronosclerospora sorghi]|uniref:Uncharacterized protein n=1 Tax=Peronosclerospora sorghi TaxID=230839 RepID=A0ACC0WLP5_9STRA|nr:hypothetical protein PsorP6_012149 [Peronosclerospora sorghi]